MSLEHIIDEIPFMTASEIVSKLGNINKLIFQTIDKKIQYELNTKSITSNYSFASYQYHQYNGLTFIMAKYHSGYKVTFATDCVLYKDKIILLGTPAKWIIKEPASVNEITLDQLLFTWRECCKILSNQESKL